MTRFQNFSHYKLPITMDPLKYGKLLEENNQKFIIQLTTKNIAIINQYPKENFVRIFKNGELVLEFRDKFLSDNLFSRTIHDSKFTFENEKLIRIEISTVLGLINIFDNPLSVTFVPAPDIGTIFSFLYLNYWKVKIKFTLKNLLLLLLDIYLILVILGLLFIMFSFINLIFSIVISFFSDYLNYFKYLDESDLTKAITGVIKLRNLSKNKNLWEDFFIKLNNQVFNEKLFNKIYNQFWNRIDNKFTEDNYMFILFKIKYIDNQIVTIGKLQTLTKISWYFGIVVILPVEIWSVKIGVFGFV